ncbi:MAG TPA: PQQ-binding-like beta-propeller repeat protein [Verrucomicrobiae bacterium]|nr:PQQ-binding-like beta-propeller repeat protein [Verrucomicrobiae bacterium]
MNSRSFIALFAAFVASTAANAETVSWPQFRGPRFDNCFPGQHLPAEFGPGTNVLWKTELPPGQGSPCIVGDRVFLTAFSNSNSVETIAINRRDGSVLWRRAITPDKVENFLASRTTPAASTCASDGDRVVTYFGSYGLICHNLKGRELWRVPMPLPQTKDGFGSGSSPVIHEGIVYLLRDEDGPGQGLYAFNVKNGKPVWKRKRDGFRVSFGSPVVWDNSLVVIGDLRVKGYDLKTGEDRWVARGLCSYPCTTPAPGADGNLYIATWSNGSANEPNMPEWKDFLAGMDRDKDGKLTHKDAEGTFLADFFDRFDSNKNGFIDPEEWQASLDFLKRGKNVVLSIRPGGRGDVTDTHVRWSHEKGAPYVSSPLFYDGRLYIIKDGGLLTVYEGATGKLLLDKERVGVDGEYYASPVAVGDKIVLAALKGVILVLGSGDKLDVLAKVDLGETLAATPVMVGGTLYVRGEQHLWAFRAPK